MKLAAHNVLQDKTRLALSVAGVAGDRLSGKAAANSSAVACSTSWSNSAED